MARERVERTEETGPMQHNDTSPLAARRRPFVHGRAVYGRVRPTPPRWRPLILIGCLAATTLAAERNARALQGGEDASTLPVLIDKKSGLAGKIQFSLLGATTLASKFTESTGGVLNVTYNFDDQFGLELTGGFFNASEVQLVEDIRAQATTPDLQFSDLHQLQWLAALDFVWVPIYGKISFASEWNPSFDLYILAGGNIVGTQRQAANGTETDTAFGFNFGGGLRVFILPWFAIRLEVRDYFYADPDSGETNVARDEEISGLTNVLLGQAGFQFSFGGGQ